MDDVWVFVIVSLASGLVIGLSGFGSSLVLVGGLSVIVPVTRAVPIAAMITFSAALVNLWTVRYSVPWDETWPILTASIPAVAVGVYLLTHLDAAFLRIGVGVMILVGCLVALWSPSRPRLGGEGVWKYLTGLASGFTGGALGTSGPPVVLYALLRGWDKLMAKGVMSAFFALMSVWRIAVLVMAGVLTIDTFRVGLLMLVPAMTGLYLGVRIFRRISTRAFRWAALLILAGIAARLLLAG